MHSNSHWVEAMQALKRKTLCRTPTVFTGNTGTALTFPLVSAYSRPRPLYKTMRSSHAPSAKEHNDKEPEPSSAEDDKGYGNREDMAEAFGVAYATQSSEEGYGEMYQESIEVIDSQKDTTAGRNAAAEAREEHDESQGSKVKEKEQGRHATEESAYPPHDRPLPSGGKTCN